jgi:hypothetical protein
MYEAHICILMYSDTDSEGGQSRHKEARLMDSRPVYAEQKE